MADSLQVKLGADTSEFRGQLAGAVQASNQSFNQIGQAGANAATRFGNAFEHKLFGMRHLSGAVATALGLNFEKIGESVARFIIGFSHEEEEALKKVQELGRQTAEVYDKLFESRRSNSQNIEHLQSEQNRLLKESADIEKNQREREKTSDLERYASSISYFGLLARKKKEEENSIKRGEDQVKLAENSKQLAENQAKIDAFSGKTKEEDAKRVKEDQDDVAEGNRQIAEKKEKDAKKQKENQDAAAQFQDHLNQLKDREHKLALDLLPPSERLVKLQEDRKKLNDDIVSGGHDEETNIENKIKLHEQDLEIVRLTADIQEEARKKEKSANMDLGVAKSVGGFSRFFRATDQQAYEKQLVDSAQRDTQEQITALQETLASMTSSGSSAGKYEAPALQEKLRGLKSRQTHLQDFVFNPNYSDAAGQGIFAQQVSTIGDPLGLQKKSTDTLGEISGRLATIDQRLHVAGFGKTPSPGQGNY